jgi:hypothetical protein
MTKAQSVSAAVELIKAALGAGWLSGVGTGEGFSSQVNAALNAIAENLEKQG